MVQSTILKVAEDGTLAISQNLLAELGVGPQEEVEVIIRDGTLVVRRPHGEVLLTDEDRARWQRVEELLQKTLAGADWDEIHAGRADCPNRDF